MLRQVSIQGLVDFEDHPRLVLHRLFQGLFQERGMLFSNHVATKYIRLFEHELLSVTHPVVRTTPEDFEDDPKPCEPELDLTQAIIDTVLATEQNSPLVAHTESAALGIPQAIEEETPCLDNQIDKSIDRASVESESSNAEHANMAFQSGAVPGFASAAFGLPLRDQRVVEPERAAAAVDLLERNIVSRMTLMRNQSHWVSSAPSSSNVRPSPLNPWQVVQTQVRIASTSFMITDAHST